MSNATAMTTLNKIDLCDKLVKNIAAVMTAKTKTSKKVTFFGKGVAFLIAS